MSAPESPAAFLRRAADHLDGPGRLALLDLEVAALLRACATCECDEDSDHWEQKQAALKVAAEALGETYPPEPEEPEAPAEAPAFTRRPGEVQAVIGANLLRLRHERGWTLEFVAGKAGVSNNTVSYLERGLRSGGAFNLLAVATVYGVTLDYLVTPHEDGAR
jgi:DNA-binding XRE family transcriptional regulator